MQIHLHLQQQLQQMEVIQVTVAQELMQPYQINVGLDVYVPSTGWGAGTWGAGGFGDQQLH